jgi:signal transduction histidine kinase
MATPQLLNLSSIVGTVFALEFTRRFLNLRTLANPLHRTIFVLQAGWALIILMHLIWTPGALVAPLIAPAALITTLLIVICGLVGLRRRAPGALYFCIAWSALLGSGTLVALTRGGALPYLPLGDPLAMLGAATELMLLSLALGDRMQGERRARAEAEALQLAERVQREAAQQALREKSAFMASVVHDLKQPIYALNLTTTSLARRGADPALASHVTSMQFALRAADDLLSSLAMVVRLDRADLKPEIGDFCIQHLLEQVSELFGPLARQRGLDWRVTPSVATVHSDARLLERMVSNLVSNAMRYTRRGGVLLACRLRSDHLLIQVWDTGRGIPADQQVAVFEMHYRGAKANGDEDGLGLGLSIVQRCANLLDIRVSLRSVPGRGSCFSLRVPLGSPALTGSA